MAPACRQYSAIVKRGGTCVYRECVWICSGPGLSRWLIHHIGTDKSQRLVLCIRPHKCRQNITGEDILSQTYAQFHGQEVHSWAMNEHTSFSQITSMVVVWQAVCHCSLCLICRVQDGHSVTLTWEQSYILCVCVCVQVRVCVSYFCLPTVCRSTWASLIILFNHNFPYGRKKKRTCPSASPISQSL